MTLFEIAVFIIGFTEAAKQFGLRSKQAPYFSILVGILALYMQTPTLENLAIGALFGAVVTGFYALFKRIGRAVLVPQKPKSLSKNWNHLEPDPNRMTRD